MQNKTMQHKHRTLHAIKKSNTTVKNKRNDKRLYNNNDKKRYDYVPSVPYIHSVWS